MIRRLHWKLVHQLRMWGMERVAGVLLLLLAVAIYTHTYFTIEKPYAEAAKQVLQMQAGKEAGAVPTATNPNAPPLPAASTALASLGQLQQLAADSGLLFDSGQFRQEKTETLMRYRISLPVIGSYVDLRAFLAKSVAHFPNLALEGLSISREEPGMEEVDATVQMSFYFRP